MVSGLMPVAAGAQKVTYDYNKTADFARLRSYALEATLETDNPLVAQRIKNAIARGLSQRGLRTNDADPDVYVAPRVTQEIRQEVTAYNNGWGPGWYGYGWYGHWYGYDGWGTTTLEVQDVRYDTLTIDMIDARTGALLWRGTGVKQVNPNWKPDTVDKKVNETVAKILRNFPPALER
jgi:hypothetical protein